MNYLYPLKLLPAAAVLASLAACGSSSSGPEAPLASQAVDGYIVNAEVLCDDTLRGVTKAAGRFTCPAGTQLNKIRGGFDVGIDELATTGTIAFMGVLTAPATEPFVTPMTTLSVAIAQIGQPSGFTIDSDSYRNAQSILAQTLGITAESLTANPVKNLDAAKGNAKIHQILSAFSPNLESYGEVTSAFATVINDSAKTGATLDLTSGAPATLSALNEKLVQLDTGLWLATVDLDQVSFNIMTANQAIDNAETPAKVTSESQKELTNQAPVTIDRTDASVTLYNEERIPSQQLSIDGFESGLQQTDGLYAAQLYSGLTRVDYDNDVFQFNQNINEARVTVAFEVKSVNSGDQRAMTFVSDDVVVTAIKRQSDSLSISMLSSESTFEVVGKNASGVMTEATVETDGETFSSDGETLTINLEKINRQLSNLGFEDILSTSGDYSVTLVIAGLRINERDGNDTIESKQLTLDSGMKTVTGNGFRGYVSVIR